MQWDRRAFDVEYTCDAPRIGIAQEFLPFGGRDRKQPDRQAGQQQAAFNKNGRHRRRRFRFDSGTRQVIYPPRRRVNPEVGRREGEHESTMERGNQWPYTLWCSGVQPKMWYESPKIMGNTPNTYEESPMNFSNTC